MVCICLWHQCGYISPIWVISKCLSFETFFFWRFLLIHWGSASSFPSQPDFLLAVQPEGRVNAEGGIGSRPFPLAQLQGLLPPPAPLSISPAPQSRWAWVQSSGRPWGAPTSSLSFRNTRSRNALSLLFAPCCYY